MHSSDLIQACDTAAEGPRGLSLRVFERLVRISSLQFNLAVLGDIAVCPPANQDSRARIDESYYQRWAPHNYRQSTAGPANALKCGATVGKADRPLRRVPANEPRTAIQVMLRE
jgi:hypothetical protein